MPNDFFDDPKPQSRGESKPKPINPRRRLPRRLTGPIVSGIGARLARLHPALDGVTFGHHWTGTVGISARQRPAIFELDDGLWGLLGYSGRGVPTSTALRRAFATTLIDRAEGARLWPPDPPARIPGRVAIGLAVQTQRGPLNKLRDGL